MKNVAPFTGAWIEIAPEPVLDSYVAAVAPFTGAWIEITAALTMSPILSVAPFTGAWIEIMI